MKTPEKSLCIDSDTYNKIVDECIYGEHKPAEWSEEDEEMLNLIIARLHSHPNVDSEEYSKEYHWLNYNPKSLRHQEQWKPSEEQLKSLKGVIDVGYFTSYPNSLETLYEQLKKLK